MGIEYEFIEIALSYCTVKRLAETTEEVAQWKYSIIQPRLFGTISEKFITPGSRISIAVACFSIYAYQELKDQLEGCDELRFIFTSPTFVAEKGTMETLNLKPIEQAKIKCAKKLFAELSTEDVVYHDVDSYQSLLNIMESL